jgi:hypothetical protein
MMHLHGVLNTTIKGNVFRRSGAVDIGLVNCDGTQVVGNLFIESNVINDLNRAIVEASDSNTHTLILSDNEVIKGKLGKAQGLVKTANNNTQVRLSGNRMDDKNDILVRTAATNVVSEASSIAGQSGRNRIFFGSTIPVAGYYQQGDIMFSQGAAASGQVGWVCVTSGSPGAWKAFGNIQP